MFNCTNREGLPESQDVYLHKLMDFLLNEQGKRIAGQQFLFYQSKLSPYYYRFIGYFINSRFIINLRRIHQRIHRL